MHRPVATALLGAISVAFGACGSIVDLDEGPAGTYVLQTVQGVAVPYRLTDHPSLAISGRKVILSPEGAFTDVVELSVADHGWSEVIPSTRRGVFTDQGTSLSLEYADGRTLHAELVGHTLTLDDTGLIFVLAR